MEPYYSIEHNLLFESITTSTSDYTQHTTPRDLMESSTTNYRFYSSLILLIIVGRTLGVPLFFFIMRLWEPEYSSSRCLMKLVNVTNPVHFQAHYFYQGTSFSDDCDLDSYVYKQFHNEELKYLNVWLGSLFISSISAGIYEWRNVLSLRYFIVMFAGLQAFLIQHCHYHFGQDVTFFAGNIMHHADTSIFENANNASLVATAPQGLFFTLCISTLWCVLVRSLIVKMDPTLNSYISWKTLFSSTAMSAIYVSYLTKYGHPHWHEIATENMISSFPCLLSTKYMAFAHVFKHHSTGEAFGPAPLWDWIFNYILQFYSYLHNTVLQLTLQTYQHYAFVIVFEILLSIFVTFLFWGVLRLACAADKVLFGGSKMEVSAEMDQKLKKKVN